MSEILDGKAVAKEIRGEVAEAVGRRREAGKRPPGLVAVLVGENPASQVYVRSKMRACDEAGIVSRTERLDRSVSEAELLAVIDRLNRDDEVDGILVQLPLPDGIAERRVLEAIAPAKDVDGFHPISVGKLWTGQDSFVPATPSGIMELLRRTGRSPAGKTAVVVGRSNIVGKPMAALLLAADATVTVCHSRTPDLPAVCRQADILVAAVGRTALIGPDHVKPGAVVVDVGMNRITDEAELERLFPGDEKRRARFDKRGSVLTGDVDYTRVAPIAGAITPVPGGVGPLTVAMLLVNTLTSARRRDGEGRRDGKGRG